MAAVEFAIMLPVLVTLFLGSIDAGRAIATYMKVRTATFAVASISNQYTTIQSSDMTAIMAAAGLILTPYSSTPLSATVSQIKVSSATSATVNWSASLNGTPLSQGASITVPASFRTCNSYPCYLIYSQMSYSYSPMFGFVFPSSIVLSDQIYVTPRRSLCVQYPPQNVNSSPC